MNYIPISPISGGGRSSLRGLGSSWGPVASGGFGGPVGFCFRIMIAEKIEREHPG